MIEHFDLTGKKAIVVAADNPAGAAIAEAWLEAGAEVKPISQGNAEQTSEMIQGAVAELGGLHLLATSQDLFLAKPFTDITMDDIANVMMANFATTFVASQAAVSAIRDTGDGGNLVLVTNALGERGLPNTSIYGAAHGAVFNLIRGLAQEVAAQGISVNGIELGWMEWMSDRLDPKDESAMRAIRFTMLKRSGKAEEVGPLATWLAGSAAGFVTGQIFPLDGGLTQHL
jgi:3-oxoacyl-[acyl-carrier protein] reductase